MNNSEDQILARELGKVGSIGGPGGRSGATFAARFLPTETFRSSLRIEADAREVLQAVFRILVSMGEITDESAEASGRPRISTVVGSGFLRMNPALVHVQVVPASEHASEVIVSAAAKEGLIKQRTAEKAVGRFREELLKTYA